MYPKDNTVILDGHIVGQYHDDELGNMVEKLADYYKVSILDFTITKENPFELGLVL